MCKKIFHASADDENGKRCLVRTRNKALAVSMIINPGSEKYSGARLASH